VADSANFSLTKYSAEVDALLRVLMQRREMGVPIEHLELQYPENLERSTIRRLCEVVGDVRVDSIKMDRVTLRSNDEDCCSEDESEASSED
jgi:hypothetical protein